MTGINLRFYVGEMFCKVSDIPQQYKLYIKKSFSEHDTSYGVQHHYAK